MAIAELYAGTQAVDTTEWSITTDTAGPDSDATDGVYQIWLDVSDMVTGDQLLITIYEGHSTQRILYRSYLYGPQPFPIWVSPTFVFMTAWDCTLDALAGTITVDWSVRQIT